MKSILIWNSNQFINSIDDQNENSNISDKYYDINKDMDI